LKGNGLNARQHLTRAELDRLISEEGGPTSEWIESATAHLDGCRRCRLSLLFGDARIASPIATSATEESCPDDSKLQSAAVGAGDAETAIAVIQHAIKCSACAAKLKEYANVSAGEPPANIDKFKTSDHQWQKSFAREIAASQKRPVKPQSHFSWMGWAVAALLLVGLSAWFYSQQDSVAKVNRLVASAYTESRTTDLRLSGAEYSEVHTQRGTTTKTSQPLAEARAAIERMRPKMQDKPEFLDADARADLVSNDVESAYDKLKRANAAAPGSSEILTNLGIAECLLADGGQSERYQVSYELLSQAIEKDDRNIVALFNRAIVAERLRQYTSAVADWKRVLALETKGAWADEANRRKTADETLLQHHTRAPAENENSSEAAMEGPVLDSLASTPQNSSELSKLATETLEQHQDPWLRNTLATRKAVDADAFASLAKAHRENAASDHDHALPDAKAALDAFTRSHNVPGSLRAKAEVIYALHRSGKSHECAKASDELTLEAQAAHYWWIQGFASVENHVCVMMLGDLVRSSKLLDQSESIAKQHAFKILAVRLIGMRAGLRSFSGNSREAWRLDIEGLDEFWRGWYPPIRAYQFYSDMVTLSQNSGHWHTALSSSEEAALMAGRTQYRYAEAIAYLQMGQAENNLGHGAQAFADFDKSSKVFSILPATPTTQFFRVDAEVRLADLAQGTPLVSAERLESLRPQLESFASQSTNLYYFDGLGRAWERAGNFVKAEASYRGAAKEFQTSLAGEVDTRKRTQLMRQSGPPFRGLVRSLLKQDKTGEALEAWEQWRGPSLAGVAKAVSKSSTPLELVAAAAPHAREETFVSYFRMPDGLAIWAFDDRGVHFTKVNVDSHQLDSEASLFIEMCSDPNSNLAKLQASGAQLYTWYLKPIEKFLSPDRTLVILPEDADWNLPFAALRTPDGKYLAERFRLTQAPDFAEWLYARSAPALRATDSALIVASPGGAVKGLAALPETISEAESVGALFPKSVLLSGVNANVETVTQRLRQAAIFHYGGHAMVSTASDSLVLPGGHGTEVAFDPATLPPQVLRNLQLVMLAGCSTGRERNEMTPVESLSRQFVRAGIPNVVAAHWAVDSVATSTFVQSFYRDLLKGDSVSESVRQSGLDLLHTQRSSHPYYWAAFTTYGRG
jgi:CHAT domain-containing protein/cytochrome c-type biogenesis protein CcmH/NrfG